MLFSRRTWLPVLLWLGPVLAFACGLKIWKLRKVAGSFQSLVLFEGLRWDIFFFLGFAVLFMMLLEHMSRWRFQWLLLLALSSQFLMLLAGVEHGFFMITGTSGDWFLLQYGLRSLADPATLQVFINQAKGPRILLLLLPPLFMFLPVWWMRRPKIAAWLDASPQREKQTPGWFFHVGLVVALITTMAPEHQMRGDLQTLSHNLYVRIVGGMFEYLFRQDPDIGTVGSKGMLFQGHRLRAVPTSRMKKKNVVFILLESQRARSLTPYKKLVGKHPHAPKMDTTPFLNEIAKKSFFVEHMSTVIPHTSKALVTMLCGIFPKVTVDSDEGEKNGIPTRCLPSLLKQVGYRSVFFQSATNHFEGRSQMVANMGFDMLRGHEDLSTRGFDKTNYFGYEDRILLKPSLHWIDKHRDRPFFMSYLFLVSHHTYTTPMRFRKRLYTKSRDPELNSYYNSLYYVDDFLRDLFKGFEKRGMMKDTIFVFVGDHGEAFSEHGRRQHDNIMWEEGLHIPAFIYAPSFNKGRQDIKGPRLQVDLLPSVLELLGLRLEGGTLPGKSLLQPVSPNRPTHHSCWYENQCMALREGNYKYIYHYKHRPWEIYDLVKDPLETKNLYFAKGFKRPNLDVIEKRLLRWKAEVNHVYRKADEARVAKAVSSTMPRFQKTVGVTFGDYARVVGYSLESPSASRGGTIRITYIFEALRPIPRKWNLFFHIEPTRPFHFVNGDHNPGGGVLTPDKWKPGTYIIDEQEIHVPADQWMGSRVNIYLGMWSRADGRMPYRNLGRFKIDKKGRLLLVSIPITR
ncbi:MAG: sulfatase-like hydrolase/transferase [Myxococcales bacterium]|nr:sulfatase-like hydrolase/transferase [Myxococcales bacterium]MCB9644047.1 sulfatase-like hydrolase/transferase [Myxococcales bacterium]